jgi:hypothetical protein
MKKHLLDNHFDLLDLLLASVIASAVWDYGFFTSQFLLTAIVVFILGCIKESLK